MRGWLGEAAIDYRADARSGRPAHPAAGFAQRRAAQHRLPRLCRLHGDPATSGRASTLLLALARERTVAIFCAETLWWRCHRRLIADAAVLLAGFEVIHLTPSARAGHVLTPGVRRAGRFAGLRRGYERRVTASEPLESARQAGLRYMTDDVPGIRRLKARGGFRYVAPDGKPLTDEAEIARIRSLAIPPAYTDFGSRRSATRTCRPPGATHAAANSTATTSAGARCATRTSSTACSRSPKRCRKFARRSTRSRPARHAARESAGRRGRAARSDDDPRRQRRVRAR